MWPTYQSKLESAIRIELMTHRLRSHAKRDEAIAPPAKTY